MPEFITPPPFGTVGDNTNNQNYAIGSTVTFSWTGTTADTAGMNLWLKRDVTGYTCTALNLANTQCWLINENNQGTSFSWNVNIPTFNGAGYDSRSPWYWIHMYDSDNTFGGEFGSHYFNVLPSSLMPASASLTQTRASTSTTASTATSAFSSAITTPASSAISSAASSLTPASSAASSRVTTAELSETSASRQSAIPSSSLTSISGSSRSGTATNAAASATSSAAQPVATSTPTGLSSTAKIAIGCAVGIGIPLIALLAVIAFFLSRNNKRKHAARAGGVGGAAGMSERGSSKEYVHEKPVWKDTQNTGGWEPSRQPPVHEMESQNFRITSPSELDAHPYRR
ncbi:hypothetical protein LTR64_003897 [Lithohypha guttulata]|uniref:uncharacterized protein n=1 Tax=Lithohypha guttulata TaxID=1690604 RepID=UPI002DE03064|nr:hypothetical protein LTR51_006935 [Lithohypha guttulata]